jgi:hypothetical protein
MRGTKGGGAWAAIRYTLRRANRVGWCARPRQTR